MDCARIDRAAARGRAGHVQSTHCAATVSLLRAVPPAGRGCAVLTVDVCRCPQACDTIVKVTERRYMPPWLPEPVTAISPGTPFDCGSTATDRGMGQTRLDRRRCGRFTSGTALHRRLAEIGPPDLVVQMPRAYRLAAGGGDVFRSFVIPVDVKKVKYVRAIELRPGDKRIVHHANIWIDRRRSLRRRDGEDGEPGFAGMENFSTEARSDSFDPDSHFLFGSRARSSKRSRRA